jgi:hypothetical protein
MDIFLLFVELIPYVRDIASDITSALRPIRGQNERDFTYFIYRYILPNVFCVVFQTAHRRLPVSG